MSGPIRSNSKEFALIGLVLKYLVEAVESSQGDLALDAGN